MAASVVEVLQGSLTATSTVVPITTALVPGDLVVVFSAWPGNSQGAVTPSGLGTWSADVNGITNGTNDYGVRVHMLSGVTGAGNVTLSMPSTSYSPQYVILVMRGLEVPIMHARHASFTSSSTGNPVLTGSTRGTNTVAVDVWHSSNGTVTIPTTASPSTGWVLDRNTGGGNGIAVAHNIIDTEQTVTVQNQTAGGNYALGSTHALYIFGTPLETRVHSEYVTTIYNGAGVQAPRSVRTEYVETLRNDAVVPRAVYGMSVDALTTGATAAPRAIHSEYAESLEQVVPGTISTSTVRAENAEILYQAPPGVTVRGEYINVLSTVIPPAANAAVYNERADVLTSARRVMIANARIEVLRKWVDPTLGNSASMGWGIPFTD